MFTTLFSFWTPTPQLAEAGRGALGGESPVRQGLLVPLGGINTVRKGELNILLGKLHAVGPLQVGSLDSGCPDDLNGPWACAVAPSHLVVQLRDGAGESEVTELAVHVVRARAGRVTEPDAIVLHSAGVLLMKFDTVKDLASGLLHLAELVEVVPELRLSDDRVRGEDDHAVGLWVGVLLGSTVAAHHLVLAHFPRYGHFFDILQKLPG